MGEIKWQRQVLLDRNMRMLVRVPRATGKTTTGIKWAKDAGQTVLYLAPSQGAANLAFETARTMLRNEMLGADIAQKMVVMKDGVRIYFAGATSETLRGKRVDAVVFDEISHMSNEAIDAAFDCMGRVPKFLALYSQENKAVTMKIKQVPNVVVIVQDYMDLLEQGVLSAERIRHAFNYIHGMAFLQTYGPFEREEPVARVNMNFTHLLQAE